MRFHFQVFELRMLESSFLLWNRGFKTGCPNVTFVMGEAALCTFSCSFLKFFTVFLVVMTYVFVGYVV